jgi:hypothetical protein
MLPSQATVRKRIQYWWDREQAKTIPLLHNRYDTSIVDSTTISKRIYKWWSLERATTTPKKVLVSQTDDNYYY